MPFNCHFNVTFEVRIVGKKHIYRQVDTVATTLRESHWYRIGGGTWEAGKVIAFVRVLPFPILFWQFDLLKINIYLKRLFFSIPVPIPSIFFSFKSYIACLRLWYLSVRFMYFVEFGPAYNKSVPPSMCRPTHSYWKVWKWECFLLMLWLPYGKKQITFIQKNNSYWYVYLLKINDNSFFYIWNKFEFNFATQHSED